MNEKPTKNRFSNYSEFNNMKHIHDIEQLRQTWRQVNIRPPQIEKAKSLKERLVSRLKRPLFAMAGCLAALVPLVHDMHIPGWFVAFYCIFCALAGCFTFIQTRMLKRADFSILPTVDAIRFIKRFSIIRQRMKTILITLAIPLIGMLMWFFDSHKEPPMLFGALAGALAGGVIGWNMNHRFKRDMQKIEESLGDISETSTDSSSDE